MAQKKNHTQPVYFKPPVDDGRKKWIAVKYCPCCGRPPEDGVEPTHDHIANFTCNRCQLFIQVWIRPK